MQPVIWGAPTRSFAEVSAEQALAAREILELLWPYVVSDSTAGRSDAEAGARKRLLLISELSGYYFPERRSEALKVLPFIDAHDLSSAYWAVSNLRLGMILG